MLRFNRITPPLTTFIFLLTTSTFSAQTLHIDQRTYLEHFRKQYLASFWKKEVEKPKKEQDLSKKFYENLEQPRLSKQQCAIILTSKVYPQSQALKDFLNYDKEHKVIFDPDVWEDAHLLLGPASAPDDNLVKKITGNDSTDISQIALTSLGMRLTNLTFNTERLLQERYATEELIRNPYVYNKLKKTLASLHNLERSFLSFYDDTLDPTQTAHYKKLLQDTFPHKEEKFVDEKAIQLSKRLYCDLLGIVKIAWYPILILIVAIPIYISIKMKGMQISFSFDKRSIFAILYITTIGILSIIIGSFFARSTYKKYKSINDYLRLRIYDASRLVHIAQEVSSIVQANPILEKALGYKMSTIRALLKGVHENKDHNKLMHRLLHNNFRDWSIWFDSTGTLLTTLTSIKDNLSMCSNIIVELGQVACSLFAADMIKSNAEYSNTYVYPDFIEDEAGSVQMSVQGFWNPVLLRERAVPNDLAFTTKLASVLGIVGPNAGGKSQVGMSLPIICIFTGAGLGIPCTKGKLTVVAAISSLTPSQEDTNSGLSFFAKAVNKFQKNMNVIQYCQDNNLPCITLIDELFSGTNHDESGALYRAILEELIAKFTNNMTIVICHHKLVATFIDQHPKAELYHMAIRHLANGEYENLFKLKKGNSSDKDRTGILVFEKLTGNKKIAQRAKEIMEKDHA